MESIPMSEAEYKETRDKLGKSELVSLHKEIDDENGIVEDSSNHIKYVYDKAASVLRFSFKNLRGTFTHTSDSIKEHFHKLVEGTEKQDPNVQPEVHVPTPPPEKPEEIGDHSGPTDTSELIPQPEEKEERKQEMQDKKDESNEG